MNTNANLIRRLKIDQTYLLSMDFHDEAATISEAADALQAMERKPMTEDQIWNNDEIMSLNAEMNLNIFRLMKFVKLVEAFHGIQPNVKGE